MEKAVKSSPEYIMDENHFKDFEYEFDYCIIHDKNDIGYFSGTLTSALAEFMVFKDNESFMHFLAVLIQSKILIPVGICPPGQNTQTIIKIFVHSLCNRVSNIYINSFYTSFLRRIYNSNFFITSN